MKVITLCGSTKFKKEFIETARLLTMQTYIVLSPAIYEHAEEIHLNENKKQLLDKMHRQRIDMSEAIIVINKNGYIGESTAGEIEYARSQGKEVYYRYMYCNKDCALYDDTFCEACNLPAFGRMTEEKFPQCPLYCKK